MQHRQGLPRKAATTIEQSASARSVSPPALQAREGLAGQATQSQIHSGAFGFRPVPLDHPRHQLVIDLEGVLTRRAPSAMILERFRAMRRPGPDPAGERQGSPEVANTLAAQVVLRSQERARSVMHQFAESGFAVGPVVGISFSIAGPPTLFSRFFGLDAGSEVEPVSVPDAHPQLVPPPSLRADVETILFTPPPDFGPTSF